MKTLLVCMQHNLNQQQFNELKDYDIFYLKDVNPDLFKYLANCSSNEEELRNLSFQLIEVANKYSTTLLPIGSPAFMYLFAQEFLGDVLFAHSQRMSVDEPQADGSVKKVSVFKHLKFIKL